MTRGDAPRLLLLGARGQVGWELARTLVPLGDVRIVDRGALDIADLDAVRATIRKVAPNVIVNAAAYTDVDGAESEADLANRINGDAPGVLAEEATRQDALLVHYSTDYVFDGESSRPYTEEDPPSPRTAYGESKLAGDEAVSRSGAEAYVFRVGWVYGTRRRNFLRTIQRIARQKDELRVVADQHGAPTWSRAIAEASAQAVGQWLAARRESRAAPMRGIYNMAGPDHSTWHEFASAIVEGMTGYGETHRPVVTAIQSADYPTPAVRPKWSVLDSTRLVEVFGLRIPPWREQLVNCLETSA